ncbi:DAP3-binding cell death enhancer 1-like [Protopterus annectens]|uniref:DAP3-binding cell death enhancer 1-like n=1 Tax=Protopterus annectens TaxID=7888 RepID=UPI001CFB3400|nr:DAP3-binding cell death enhancer 1-like [Protopterus annectens]
MLSKSVSHLQKANESSVAIILNIMGLDCLKTGEDNTALSCFQVAADYGYCKAVYNAGVCYELGRGVVKDMIKAAAYYRCAAEAGHNLAQYRYAKYLLSPKHEKLAEDVYKAVTLLQQAAKAGLPEAQAYLGVFYMKLPYQNDVKAVQYLQLAARSGDTSSLYHLGLCYENGLGVQQNLQKALKLYYQAASSGCLKAQEALESYCKKSLKGFENCNQLKAVLSVPCLSTLERVPHQMHLPGMHSGITPSVSSMCSSSTALPHSWSTGNMCTSSARSWDIVQGTSLVGKKDQTVAEQHLSAGWTVGIG